MPTPQTLGARLKQARLNLGAAEGNVVSPEELARRMDVTGQSIRAYEKGKREPGLGVIVRLAAAVSVTPGWLAFGEAAGIIPVLGGPQSAPADPAKPLPRSLPRPGAAAAKKGRGTA